MRKDLIYDVGVDNGADTAYYLSKGFSVVAIEANPASAHRLRERFAQDIASGRVTLLNSAISTVNGQRTFYACSQHPALSSFDEDIVRKSPYPFEPVTVACVRFGDVLKQYGVPYYLKVDIEGSDHLCLRDIDPADAPEYVSFELLNIEDLFLLASRGYNQFKCIRQDTLSQIPLPSLTLTSVRQDFERWVQTSYARHPAFLQVLALPKAAARSAIGMLRGSTTGRPSAATETAFAIGATGPFGEESPGVWQTLEEVCYAWLDFRFRHTAGRMIWTDIHAKRSQASDQQQISVAR